MVVKNALFYSKRTAYFTSLGIACGIVVHVTYCILGLAVIITKSLLLFNILKYLGASYLVYIGIKSLFEKKAKITRGPALNVSEDLTPFAAWRQGFLCNVLNPKAALFFLGLFTLVINPNTSSWVETMYGAVFFLDTFLWFSFLSTIIHYPGVRTRINKVQYYLAKGMGFFLILFGLELAFFRRPG